MTRNYLPLARIYALDVVAGEGRAQELVTGEIIDHSKPPTNTEVTDPYQHWNITVGVDCLFCGDVQIKLVSWCILVAYCRGKNDVVTEFRPATVRSRQDTICRAFACVPNNIHNRYVGRRKEKVTSCGSLGSLLNARSIT